MKIAELRKAANILHREGIAVRALAIATEIVRNGSYKRAIEGLGQMEVLAKSCTFDEYWDEKRHIGISSEEFRMRGIILDSKK